MSLILAATGAAGFLTSFALLHAGVWRMWLRYAAAVLVAYLVFLLLLRLWLFLQGRDLNIDLDLDLFQTDAGGYTGGGAAPDSFGGGGDFAGGGASGGWGGGAGGGLRAAAPSVDAGGASGGGGGGGLLDSIDLGVDDEGCVFFLLAVALIVAGTLAALYVVYAAPLLLAEILVEGVLLSGLYRGVKRARGGRGGGDWLRAAVRRTWLPVLLTLLTFSAAGYLLQRAAPRARSIGEAWHMVTSSD
jgi:hypothetical protein